MSITLTFPAATPSVNALHGRHWSAKAKERKRWGWLVRAAILNGSGRVPASERVQVRIVRHGARLLDHDNGVGGCKFLIDALVAEGFAIDDSPDHLELIFEQHVSRKEHYTTVVIEPAAALVA